MGKLIPMYIPKSYRPPKWIPWWKRKKGKLIPFGWPAVTYPGKAKQKPLD